MTAAHKAMLARIVGELCALREFCDDPADRFELGVILLELEAPMARPADPEPIDPDAQCVEHRCARWRCDADHSLDCLR